jgi:two-component system cell cycle sensor histidine kinase/response regulator CckA
MDAPKRILVVDDEDGVRRLVARLLTRAGYNVESACDGDDALETFCNGGKFDLIVSDVRMPGISGPRLVEKIRRVESDVKVLYLTGYADQLFIERELLWEDEAFLDKPFTAPGLLESVSLMVYGHTSPPPAA